MSGRGWGVHGGTHEGTGTYTETSTDADDLAVGAVDTVVEGEGIRVDELFEVSYAHMGIRLGGHGRRRPTGEERRTRRAWDYVEMTLVIPPSTDVEEDSSNA